MKPIRKVISVMLAVLLAASLSIGAFAATGNILLSGSAGKNVSWTLTDDGVLTVSGSGPVEDEAEYDYDEDGEISCVNKLGCISWTLLAYWEEQTGSMDIASAERARFDLVREIVVGEGITAIPEDEFDCFFPEKVSLPASLTELGYGAFDASFATQVIFNGGALQNAQFRIRGYRTDEEPYADRNAAVEGYIAQCEAEDAFQKNSLPLYALQEIYSLENGLAEYNEDELAYMLSYYNECFGTQAETVGELTEIAIGLVNRHFGTSYISIDDIIRLEEDEYGACAVYTDEVQELYQEEADRVLENGRLISLSLGEYPSEDEKVYSWLTVVAPEGSEIETLCKNSGVAFTDLYEGLCKYCHQDHSGSLWQKFVGFIHKILYFFAHLFRLK